MKITGYEVFEVPPRWLLLRVDTDDGPTGWGEPIVEGRVGATAEAVREAFDYLIGRDPLRIEDAWQGLTRMQFYRGGPVLSSAVAGIDQALWDIAGKHYGVPVHALLGGHVRDRIRIYGPANGVDNEGLRAEARMQVERGLTAVKVVPLQGVVPRILGPRDIGEAMRRVAAVRDEVGDGVDIALDFHGKFSAAAARQLLPELEPLRILFVEEPVLPEYGAEIARIVQSTSIPIATGERCYSRWDFVPILSSGVAVVQPDVSHAGGISEVRRIAAAAETVDAVVAPHCPLGPIALAASMQIDAAVPNFLIQEQQLDLGYGGGSRAWDYLLDPGPFAIVDGYLAVPTAPGLGLQIDESAVRAAASTPHRWRTPMWSHPDGSHATW